MEHDFAHFQAVVSFVYRPAPFASPQGKKSFITNRARLLPVELKEKFGLRMTWELGVTKLKFRIEVRSCLIGRRRARLQRQRMFHSHTCTCIVGQDGRHELHRKVPYDYDSEFQDMVSAIFFFGSFGPLLLPHLSFTRCLRAVPMAMDSCAQLIHPLPPIGQRQPTQYMKCCTALIEGHITVHQALVYQTEIAEGKHTARLGWFLRNLPGRGILVPLEAATCAVIFFGGDWEDFGIAAICGAAAALVEWTLQQTGPFGGVLLDALVGVSTGVIGSLFFVHKGGEQCLSAIYLGTL